MEHADSSDDRISSLPRDVTDSILERLNFREAVKTCTLSHIWRNKWKTLSKITLTSIDVDATKLETVINQILLLHTSKIHKFHLYIPLNLRTVPNIIPLMYHLSLDGIKDLDIFNDVQHSALVLPSYLFSCLELTHLSICGCLFRPPPGFSGFSCLISLECHNTQFKEVNFASFITTMPLLEVLGFYCCTGIDNLVVDAPNLKHLSIERCNDLKYISFGNTDNVTTAYIQVYGNGSTKSTDVLSSFTGFPKIEKLIFVGDYMRSYQELLGEDAVPLCLPNSLHYLRFLKLGQISLFNAYHVSSALCLIRSCPNLQELHILGADSNDDDMGSVMRYLEQALDFHTCLHQVEKISIDWIRGARPELKIIKFFLANSPMLKSLNVRFKIGAAADLMLRASMELLSFQRASTDAKVVVNTPH